MPSEERLENFLNLNDEKYQNIKEIICWVKWGKKYGQIRQGSKMLDFGASKLRVGGPALPRIRTQYTL